jgi:hypothetical protein
MGRQKDYDNLFSYKINLKQRVRSDHPLRKVTEAVDFSFAEGIGVE